MILCITACANPKPKLDTIKQICELETLTVKCNDVVKGKKKAGKGWTHILEKDRVYWIEYTGIVEMGVNADDAVIEVSDDKVYITLPEAEVLDVYVDPESINKDSIYVSNDNFINPNEFTVKNQSKIIKAAQKQLETAFEKDKEIKEETTRATKKAIENYVNKLGESFDIDYEIIWKEG